MSVQVVDPARFIIGYTGQAGQAEDNDVIFDWVKGLFMLGVKTTLGELCEVEGKSLLQAVSLTTQLAPERSMAPSLSFTFSSGSGTRLIVTRIFTGRSFVRDQT